MHGRSREWKKDNASTLKEILGKWFFVIYLLVYGGFIVVNVVDPDIMGVEIGSLNVAIVYGVGLIGLAILLAFIYNHVCTHAEGLLNKPEDDREDEE